MNYIISEEELLKVWGEEQVGQILSHAKPVQLIAEGEVCGAGRIIGGVDIGESFFNDVGKSIKIYIEEE